MKRLNIQFVHTPWTRSAWFYGLLLSLAALAAVASEVYMTHQDTAHLQAKLESLRAEPASPATRNTKPPTAELIKATNEAIGLLNLPWDEWLTLLDNESYKEVALLALEPESANRSLTVTAESRNETEMVEFLEKLQTNPQLKRSLLLHHEVNSTDPNRPERFTLELTFRTAE